MADSQPMVDPDQLAQLLSRYGVAGVSVAVIQPGNGNGSVRCQVAGYANKEKSIPVFDSTWFELASLSKTVAAAFSYRYFEARGKSMDAPVQPLLAECGTKFRLQSAAGNPPEWADEVTLGQLVDHTGLGMHYVNGVPLSKPMPPVLDLISGTAESPAPYGYASLHLVKRPGTAFGYSGGGFLVLQHLLEEFEGKPIAEIMQPYLAEAGTAVNLGVSFAQELAGKNYAIGYRDSGEVVQDTRLMFPPLAAGALGTPAGLADWLRQLAVAYKKPEGCGGISHQVARGILTPGPDKGSEAFMRAKMGLGVFVFEAAAKGGAPPSKWMLHQAANDGFRGLYLICFDGPEAEAGPRGIVVLSNGDNNAMFLNCAVSRLFLQSSVAFSPPLQCLDWNVVPSLEGFSTAGLKQEEIVNLGIKELVLNAFIKP
mmetsp:Transcript_18199/g.42349  ORF Transcript_18199/g.42349 Transcript_18199/m.42349 type:complete len:426 (-) Transcript_18199:42-1319(-)